MAKQYKTGLIITGDASGGIKAVRATEKELAQLNKGFDRGSKRSKQFARDVGGTSRELDFLKRGASIAATALAGLFAVQTLQGQIDFADQLQKTNLRIGASTEALSQYNYVAKLSGVQFNQLTTGWQRQSRRIAQAAQDTGEAKDALKTLGLEARTLAQMAPEDQFEAIAVAMQGVGNEAQRVALAQKLWDSEGVALLQIVNQGTVAIERMRMEADRLGLTISQQTANNMAAFNDEIERVKFAAQGLTTTLLADLIPSMTEGLQSTNAWVEQLGGAEVLLERIGMVAGTLATVYLARRLGPGLATVGVTGLQAGRTIAEGMFIATGATGRLNQALVIAQGRIVAVNAAGRALRGTMALLGGPAGVAILAAGAIFMYREELDALLPASERATQRVDDLTNAINLNNEAAIKSQLVNLTAQMVEVERQARETERAISAVNDSNNTPGPFRNSLVQGTGAAERRPLLEQRQALSEEQRALGEAADKLRDQLKLLAEQGSSPAASSLSDLATSTTEAEKAAKKLQESYESTAAQLEKQIALHGQTSEVSKLRYEIEVGDLRNLTQARKEHLITLGQEIDSLNARDEARKRIDQIKNAPTVGNADASVGGAFGEFARIEQQRAAQQTWYAEQIAMLRTFKDEEGQIYEEAAQKIMQLQNEQNMNARINQMQSQATLAAGAAQTLDRIRGMTAEGSAINQTLFAISKGFLIAQTLMQGKAAATDIMIQGQVAAAKAIAMNPMGGQGQAGILMAQAAGQASMVQGMAVANAAMIGAEALVGLSGQAHAGIDNVPREGTWLLDRGERVVDSRTNHDLKRYLERENRQAAQQAAGGGITIHAPVTVQAQQGMSEEESARQGRAFGRAFEAEVVRVMQKHKRPGGVLSGSK